jgi:hypothetical protein
MKIYRHFSSKLARNLVYHSDKFNIQIVLKLTFTLEPPLNSGRRVGKGTEDRREEGGTKKKGRGDREESELGKVMEEREREDESNGREGTSGLAPLQKILQAPLQVTN